jgi:hypothetical protein
MEGVLGRRCFSLGRFHQSEAVGGDVADSRARESRHRTGTGKTIPTEWHLWLAAKSAGVWKIGFCFPQTQVSNLRGWLFLAWLPQALQVREVAAAERDGQQSAFAKKRASADRSCILASQTFVE